MIEPNSFIVNIPYKKHIPQAQRFQHGYQLFAEVVKLVNTFIEKYHPQRLVLKPATPSRGKLYQRILRRYTLQLAQQGYRIIEPMKGYEHAVSKRRIAFIIQRIKKQS